MPADFPGCTRLDSPLFFFFFFLQGFGFEEKILVLKGFLKTQEYHNFSDNIFCYF